MLLLLLVLLLLPLLLVRPKALPILHAKLAVRHHLVQQRRRVKQRVFGVQPAQANVTIKLRGRRVEERTRASRRR